MLLFGEVMIVKMMKLDSCMLIEYTEMKLLTLVLGCYSKMVIILVTE